MHNNGKILIFNLCISKSKAKTFFLIFCNKNLTSNCTQRKAINLKRNKKTENANRSRNSTKYIIPHRFRRQLSKWGNSQELKITATKNQLKLTTAASRCGFKKIFKKYIKIQLYRVIHFAVSNKNVYEMQLK